MSSIRHFSFPDNTKIVAQATDKNNNFVWVTYLQNSDGNCILQKQSGFSPDEIYFSIERAISKMSDIFADVNASYVSVAYHDTTLIGESYSTTNPLTTTIEYTRPGGLVEDPIAVITDADNDNIFFLTPGSSGGEHAKIIKYSFFNNTFDQIIELTTVFDAASMVLDANNDIWLVTNTNPANVIRVYETSTNVWTYAITPIV